MSVDPIGSANAALSQISGVIRQAAQAVGTSFNYLLATARVESNFNPKAKATTSSARGLFQFIEQTWLATMKEAGPRLGYGAYADAIVKTPSGRFEVADPAMRAKILNLRGDPTANALMAGAFTNTNATILNKRLGRPPTEGELYIAHFLGAAGATRLIKAAGTPESNAAALFPNAAAANRSIFYDRQGRARSAGEVYANLTGRYDVARLRNAPARVATASPANSALKVSDTAGINAALAAGDSRPAAPDTVPFFLVLFQPGETLGGKVNQLWGGQAFREGSETAASAPEKIAPVPANSGTRELFQDMPPDGRALFGAKI
jgi:hypothetical protein